MVRLGDVATGRDNNFNLIRIVAATAVLVSHAWPIALGANVVEPLQALTGHSLGGLAVFVFFAASGFFIASSYARSRSVRVFLTARMLRLFPGLIVSLLLAALVMGPMVTQLALADYLTDPGTAAFVWRNTTLLFPQYTLPGVFTTNPYPSVEGSIWTLIHEVLCYGLVFAAGITGLLARRPLMTLALGGYVLLWALPIIMAVDIHPRLLQTRELSFPFVLGMAFWLWRDRLILSVLGALVLAGLAAVTKDTALGFPVLMLAVSYTTFWCAYAPGGRIRAYNAYGDYSYGVYVYAFPVQGLMIWLYGPMSPLLNIALAFPVTLTCAVLSWHLVEKPALDLVRARTKI